MSPGLPRRDWEAGRGFMSGGRMSRRFRVVAVSALVAAAGLLIHADQLPSQTPEIQLRLAQMLFDQGQYPEALDAYRQATKSDDSATVRQARAGLVQASLRVAEFDQARQEAEALATIAPRDPSAL